MIRTQRNQPMKIFLSVDLEGVAGLCSTRDMNHPQPGYPDAQMLMTKEVVAACEGALAEGVSEITVRDAHGSARNILPELLPPEVRLIRGWEGHPYYMMEGIDKSYDAALYLGYHAASGSAGNPLAHTFLSYCVTRINGEIISEFDLNRWSAAYEGVPSVFLAGDAEICARAQKLDEKIRVVSTQVGVGSRVEALVPAASRREIKSEVGIALRQIKQFSVPVLPERFVVELEFAYASAAHMRSWYPGVERVSPTRLRYEASDWFEVMRAYYFIMTVRGIGGWEDR
jgi:D-amino peptidase